MSRLAQAVQQQVNALRHSVPQRRGRTMNGDESAPDQAQDVTNTLTDQPATTEGAAMSTRKRAPRKSRAKTPTAAKVAKPPKAPKAAKPAKPAKGGPLPNLNDLILSPAGVSGGEKNQYITLDFTNGFSVRLYPVGFGKKKDVVGVRDLLVKWLAKQL